MPSSPLLPRCSPRCLLVLLVLTCGCRTSSESETDLEQNVPAIAASSSYLAATVRDLLGNEEPVLMLAEPGMCPGHFDLRPSQVQHMRRCRMLLRFDFQQSLDRRLNDGSGEGPLIVDVEVPGGMCETSSFLAVCEQVADALVAQGRLSRAQADERLQRRRASCDELRRSITSRIDALGLNGAAVLASGHQAAFCESLGWNVVAEFSGADSARPSQIDAAIKAGEEAVVQLIVANRPEGRQLADALGDRLEACVVVFDNFPSSAHAGGFEEMVLGNIEALAESETP